MPLTKLLRKDPEVVQRWVRYKLDPLAHKAARSINRIRLSREVNRQTAAIDNAIRPLVKNAKCYENGHYPACGLLNNLALFFLIAERDIQTSKVDALTHPDSWKRNLSLRVMLLTLHELDFGKVTGRDLRPSFVAAGMSTETQSQLFSAIRQTKKAQVKARKLLNFSRNSVIAHRDPNALEQYRQIEALSETETFLIAAEFYQAAGKLHSILPTAMLEVGTVESQLRQRVNGCNLGSAK